AAYCCCWSIALRCFAAASSTIFCTFFARCSVARKVSNGVLLTGVGGLGCSGGGLSVQAPKANTHKPSVTHFIGVSRHPSARSVQPPTAAGKIELTESAKKQLSKLAWTEAKRIRRFCVNALSARKIRGVAARR